MITLQNSFIVASINPKGAELSSLIFKENDTNYLWSGDAAFWGKHSPVLFPIVGGLKENSYIYNERKFVLGRHGFARDKNFVVESKSETEVVFSLNYDDETLKMYPFEFNFKIKYTLNKDIISCTYLVHNPGNTDLWFSVGAHPAFALPLQSNLNYNDYYLSFENDENLKRFRLVDGLISTTSEPLPMQQNILPLKTDLFAEDAIVLKKLQSKKITLQSDKGKNGLHFYFDGFDYFGVWAAKNAPFICLEPWCGIADGVNHNQQLKEKEGINTLLPNRTFERSWAVQLF
jgi:galactose mutarotase-like enzyme